MDTKQEIDKLKLATNSLVKTAASLLNLPPQGIEKLLPGVTIDHTLVHSTTRDKQVETYKELQEIYNLSLEIKIKLVRVGAYIEEKTQEANRFSAREDIS